LLGDYLERLRRSAKGLPPQKRKQLIDNIIEIFCVGLAAYVLCVLYPYLSVEFRYIGVPFILGHAPTGVAQLTN
jgi:hypothetical protein